MLLWVLVVVVVVSLSKYISVLIKDCWKAKEIKSQKSLLVKINPL